MPYTIALTNIKFEQKYTAIDQLDQRGFSAAVRDLEGLPPEILLIPLAGHT